MYWTRDCCASPAAHDLLGVGERGLLEEEEGGGGGGGRCCWCVEFTLPLFLPSLELV